MAQFLIWSNQHRMWWRSAERGYTQIIDEAGRYDRTDAERIVSHATCDGRLFTTAVDPVTGGTYRHFDEVLVMAPECIAPEGGE